jgi:hypothetical protein
VVMHLSTFINQLNFKVWIGSGLSTHLCLAYIRPRRSHPFNSRNKKHLLQVVPYTTKQPSSGVQEFND